MVSMKLPDNCLSNQSGSLSAESHQLLKWPITFQHGNVVVFKIWIFTLVDSLYDISDVDSGHCKLLPTTPNFLLLWAGHNSLNTAFLN